MTDLITIPLVGHPIPVEKCDKPTLDEVMKVQAQYIEELMRSVYPFVILFWSLTSHLPTFIHVGTNRIWNTYKNDFARSRRRELNIIE